MLKPWMHLICLAGGCWLVSPAAAELAFVNGTFEENTDGWRGQLFAEGGQRFRPAEAMIAWEQRDTAGGSRGALRVTTPPPPVPECVSLNCGVLGKLNQLVPPRIKLKITFAAKALGETRYLAVGRLWGGGGGVVALANDWQQRTVLLKADYEIDELVFTPVTQEGPWHQTMAAGTFLLDDLRIEIVKD